MPEPKRSSVAIAAIASLALLVAACGGGGTATDAPASSGPTQGATDVAPTDGVTPTDAPEATPGETTTGGGGGAGDACELVTADEANDILGMSGLTTELTPGDFSYCFYKDAAGDFIAASSYTARGGGAAFQAWKSGSGVRDVDGIGDDAVFDPSSATLFVSKGDAIFGITAGIGTDPEEQRQAWAEEFGRIAAARM